MTTSASSTIPGTLGFAAEWDTWHAAHESRRADPHGFLAITSLNDTRVLYREPAKWIARLQADAHGGPFLLKTEMNAGHGGRSGRYDAWHEEAFVLAWTVNVAGAA